MSNDKLSQVFDIPPMKTEIIAKDGEVIPYEEPKQEKTKSDIQVEKDFDKIRDNLHEIIRQGTESLYHAIEVAKQSEHPRAFEVVGNLMKQLSDINVQILDVHKKKQTIIEKKDEESSGTTKNVTNNSIFVGTTNELLNMINDMKKGK